MPYLTVMPYTSFSPSMYTVLYNVFHFYYPVYNFVELNKSYLKNCFRQFT